MLMAPEPNSPGRAEIPRTWQVKGEDQVCVTAKHDTNCYQIEKNSDNMNLYRARDISSGKITEFQVTAGMSGVRQSWHTTGILSNGRYH
jgi:hypothetical protein